MRPVGDGRGLTFYSGPGGTVGVAGVPAHSTRRSTEDVSPVSAPLHPPFLVSPRLTFPPPSPFSLLCVCCVWACWQRHTHHHRDDPALTPPCTPHPSPHHLLFAACMRVSTLLLLSILSLGLPSRWALVSCVCACTHLLDRRGFVIFSPCAYVALSTSQTKVMHLRLLSLSPNIAAGACIFPPLLAGAASFRARYPTPQRPSHHHPPTHHPPSALHSQTQHQRFQAILITPVLLLAQQHHGRRPLREPGRAPAQGPRSHQGKPPGQGPC